MALNFANNNSLSAITVLPASISGGGMTLISTQTASSSATINFTSGIDDSYDGYVFKFINIHAGTHAADFTFNGSTDGGSNYNVTKTTTTWYASHNESDSLTQFLYDTGHDIAQGTGYCQIGGDAMGTDNDQSCSGTMFLFNPSSTTFVKHFLVTMNTLTEADFNVNEYTGGYLNSTSAINAVSFKMSSGNIDSGVIKLYGIS